VDAGPRKDAKRITTNGKLYEKGLKPCWIFLCEVAI
jgi:hypothetical protein